MYQIIIHSSTSVDEGSKQFLIKRLPGNMKVRAILIRSDRKIYIFDNIDGFDVKCSVFSGKSFSS